ncbi:MAG: hypothetical protein PF569_07070 [Candidatus Woesearchaeota archaeon]|nr:hypothetical protein [Candidatus Woesearchaeota archaeon]
MSAVNNQRFSRNVYISKPLSTSSTKFRDTFDFLIIISEVKIK